jgi:nitrate reductase NapE component
MALVQQDKSKVAAGRAENDVYTVLVIVATIFLLVAIGCVAYQFVQFYGS